MSLGGRVSPWRSAVEEGRSPLGRFRKPEPCFPRTYATWDAKKDENRFGSVKFRLGLPAVEVERVWRAPVTAETGSRMTSHLIHGKMRFHLNSRQTNAVKSRTGLGRDFAGPPKSTLEYKGSTSSV